MWIKCPSSEYIFLCNPSSLSLVLFIMNNIIMTQYLDIMNYNCLIHIIFMFFLCGTAVLRQVHTEETGTWKKLGFLERCVPGVINVRSLIISVTRLGFNIRIRLRWQSSRSGPPLVVTLGEASTGTVSSMRWHVSLILREALEGMGAMGDPISLLVTSELNSIIQLGSRIHYASKSLGTTPPLIVLLDYQSSPASNRITCRVIACTLAYLEMYSLVLLLSLSNKISNTNKIT